MRRQSPVLVLLTALTPLFFAGSPSAAAVPATADFRAASFAMSDPVLDSTLAIARTSSTTATASGVLVPAVQGRTVAIQFKVGSSWKPVNAKAPKVIEDVDGKVSFNLTGLAKFTVKEYRLAVDATVGPPATAAFNTVSVKFAPGPDALGTHVLRITTDNGGLPTKKGVNYTGAVSIDGADPVLLETVAVRGNSSALKPKKPYKLKFVKSTKIFDIGAAGDADKNKSWILIPGWEDRTLVRNKMALDLAGKMSNLAWSPHSAYTEVFINGQYLGSYQLTQSIKIDSKRVNISKTDGMVVELDPHFAVDGVPGFFATKSKLPYTFKDPDTPTTQVLPGNNGGVATELLTQDKIAALKARVAAFEAVLYNTSAAVRNDPVDGYAKYLDIPSAVDLYLVKEFVKEQDSDFYRSTYFSWDHYTDPTSKFFLGPEWDADRSAGNKSVSGANTAGSPTGWYLRGSGSTHPSSKTGYYVQLTKDPAFADLIKARWAVVKPLFKAVYENDVDQAVADIGVASANDRELWIKVSGRAYPARGATYALEIAFVKNWYAKRYAWMDSQLS